jgi:alkylhydroperoxidase family enzyme
MARVSYTELGSTPFRRMVGHNLELLEAFQQLDKAITQQLSLPAELREEVRRHLAYENGCRY